MMNRNYDNHEIIKYLLGSLSESEMERLDELSIADERFANALAIAESDLVDSFVQDELTAGSLEQFKSHYLASPLRREKAEFAKALQNWGEKTISAGGTASQPQVPAAAQGPRWLSKLSFFGNLGLIPKWGFATAAVALLVAVSWLAFENMRSRPQLSQTKESRSSSGQSHHRAEDLKSEPGEVQSVPEAEVSDSELKPEQKRAVEPPAGQKQPSAVDKLSIATFILRPQMRGVDQISTVSIPINTNYVAMTLELEPGEFSAYRVVLLDHANNRVLWRSSELKAKASGEGISLSVTFRTSLLKPRAVYVLRVSGDLAQGRPEIVGEYPFKVAKQ